MVLDVGRRIPDGPLSRTGRNLAFIAFAGVASLGVTRIGVVTPIEPTYGGLLPSVLTDAPDPVLGSEANRYPVTHALVLLAATEAGDGETATDMIGQLQQSRMEQGWGLPWEWDAFGDGSVNPTTTAYALTTAFALHALLDAGATGPADRAVARYWSDRLDRYSTSTSDDVWVPSSASMAAAAVARLGYVDEAEEVFARLADHRFEWPYSERQPIPNDLQNYVYILWAGEMARDAGVSIPWTRTAAIRSLDRYGEVYPTDIEQSPDMLRRSDSPLEVSGSGIALAFTSRYGGEDDWRDRTITALQEARMVPRYAAHALFGLAHRPQETLRPDSS